MYHFLILAHSAIGFDWNPGNTRGTSYIDRLHQLRQYKAEHGTLDTITYATNKELNQFCAQLRKSHANMASGKTPVRLDAARIAELDELGFDWTLNMGHDAVQKNRSFEERLQELKEFKARHGDLHVTSKQDKSLATFCKAVRYARRHPDKAKIKVEEDRVTALNQLGFVWEPKKGPGGGGGTPGQTSKPRKTFDDRYEELVAYKNEHGHVHMTNKMDRALASCLRKWRLAKANPSPTEDSRALTHEQIAKLDDLGMDWTVPPPKKRVKRQNKSFDERIEDLKDYVTKYGHADVIPSNDKSLSDFCNNVRYAKKHPGKGISLTEDRITQLDAVGFKWSGTSVAKARPRIQQSFSQRVEALRAYREKYGNVNIIRNVDPSLHSFCDNVRFGRSHPGKGMNISEERIRMLNSVGFDWKDSARPRPEGEVQRKAVVRKTFMERIDDLKAYQKEHGHMRVTRRDDQSLADFCSNVRQARRSQLEGDNTGPGIRLTEERIDALDAIGFGWEGVQKRATGLKRERKSFEERVEDLKRFKQANGHLRVTRRDNPSLSSFCKNVRASYAKGVGIKLTDNRMAMLNAIDFPLHSNSAVGVGMDFGAVDPLPVYAQPVHVQQVMMPEEESNVKIGEAAIGNEGEAPPVAASEFEPPVPGLPMAVNHPVNAVGVQQQNQQGTGAQAVILANPPEIIEHQNQQGNGDGRIEDGEPVIEVEI